MTSSLKQLVEWYLGVGSAGPGEATAWHWQTSGWLAATPSWLCLLIVVAMVGGIVAIYRRDARSLSWKRRWSLVVLRLLTLAVLLVLLLQVSLSIDRTALPYVVLMIDDSGSMQFQDDYADTNDTEVVSSLLDDDALATRLQLGKNLLSQGLLAELLERYRLRIYRFSEQAEPLDIAAGQNEAAIAAAIDGLEGSGTETLPAAATKQVLNEFRNAAPTAVVLFTDGVSTRGPEQALPRVGNSGSRFSVPLYVVGVGSSKAAADIELTGIRVDDVAIVKEPLLFSADIKSAGFENEEVVLELRDTATGEQLIARTIKLSGSLQTAELGYIPQVAGEFDYQLNVVPPDGEHLTENNSEVRHVSVREGKIKVLLAEMLPRYEFRYLKHLLERSEGDSGSIELSTVLFDADPEWHGMDESAARLKGRLPVTADALNEFDVVILGDVDPLLISPTTQDNLRNFVREKGGGLVLIAGPNHNPHAYRGTRLEPLVPAALDVMTAADFTYRRDEGVKIEPTLSGKRGTQLFRFADNETRTLRATSQMAEVFSILKLDASSPGVTVLAESRTDAAPTIVGRQYGAGRVVLHATDDLWMWRRRSGDEYFGRYWISLIRLLSRSSLIGRDRTTELTTNREAYEQGEDVVFQLRFLDTRQEPQDRRATVSVERQSGASELVELQPADGQPGVYVGSLPSPASGAYHAWISTPAFEDTPPATDFRIENSSREMQLRDMDLAGMRTAAKATRGRFYTLGTAAGLPDDLPAGRAIAVEGGEPIPLWSRLELLLLVASLLAAEWFLRKNARLV